jgi:hypothetical protein
VGNVGGQTSTNHAYYLPGRNSGSQQVSGSQYDAAVKAQIDNYLTAGGSSASTEAVSVQGAGGSILGNGTWNVEVRSGRYTAPNLQPYLVLRYLIAT